MDLKSYFEKGYDYDQYVELLGENLDLHALHYRKFEPSDADIEKIKSVKPIQVLVLTEPWCGDSLAIFPIVRRMGEIGDWPMRMLRRDEHPELMDQYLTKNARAVPIFLFLDLEFNFLFRFGPRPKAAQDIFEEFRADFKAGRMEKSEIIKKIRGFYSRNRGEAICTEVLAALKDNDLLS